MCEKITIPKELLWDYKKAPDDILWRLQRIADFFPAYGTDRNTVRLLHKYRDSLAMEDGKHRLIDIYHEMRKSKTTGIPHKKGIFSDLPEQSASPTIFLCESTMVERRYNKRTLHPEIMRKKPIRKIEPNRILTPNQQTFLRLFAASDLSEVFRLSGGTALSAFYLEHRLSDDLDFFSSEKIPYYMVKDFLKQLGFTDKIHFAKKYDRNIFTLKLRDNSVLKTEFTYYPLKNIENTNRIGSLRIDSFKDIVVNKLCAIADRIDIKDYVDIYCAMKDDDTDALHEMIDAAEDKCEISGIRHILQSRLLQIPGGIEKLALRKDIAPSDMAEFFTVSVRSMVKTFTEI
ncbi:nucleotidyl transferase AbiEii/AbiGii toxin family protein [Desulfobacterales bacterium HSG2]|nr:nucleotidyl transferase AbiEii/AbiGii toxin family protein [Desulfobacterales bacterium HSG2]